MIFCNTSNRKRAEERLSRGEARFRATFENAAVGVSHVAPDGSWLRVNKRLCEITGYTAEELLAKSFQDITHPGDLDSGLAQVRRMLDGEIDSFGVEKRYLRKDGSIVWANVTVGCVRNADGAVDYFIAVVVDISEQKLAEIALRESEERLRLANTAAGIGTFTIDLEAGRTFCSPELAVILGIPWAESTSIDAALARVHRDDLPRARKLFLAAAGGKNGGHLKMDIRFMRPGGEVRWMTWIGRVDFRQGHSGRVPFRILGACLDITERKHQEDCINLFMQEVNHRSKNMLAIVQVIARRTAAAKPDDFLQRFDERLMALAAHQDLIVKSEWRDVDLDDLVRSQLTHCRELVDTRIELNGPSIFVSAPAAQTLGMAIHELATNAHKYGALSNERGRVRLDWVVEREEGFHMSWREIDGPCVTAPVQRGFGSTVVLDVVRRNLEADVELNYQSTGVIWQLRCALENVIDGSRSHASSKPKDAAS